MPGERQFPVLLLFALPLSAQVNVLTYQYDNTRAGANLKETVLTPGNVNANQFGKLFAYPVDGYVYGQPLYLAGVPMPGKGAHNVVYVATEHDSVYAFDADSNAGPNAAPLWQVSFLNPAAGVTTVPYQDTRCDQIVPEIGITSTPVIDPASGTLYVVAMTKEALKGVVGYVHRLHALDVSTGAERPGSPVTIQASYPGTGEGGSTLVFQPRNYKQRPGLLLLNGVVYTAWSSHCDIGVYHGWLIGYDARSLQQVAVYNNTPNGNEGSFWASGAAPAADAAGNIYLVAGNGTFDSSTGGPDLGESYIKLSPAGGLAVADYFAPFNAAALNDADVDVGSSGVALLGDEAGSSAHPHLMVGAGKEGRIYLLDRDNLGKQQAGSDSQIVQSIPGVIGSLFGTPAYFNQTVYFCGVDQSMMAFRMANGMLPPTPTSQTAARFAYPGCVPSISASGTANGIVWMLEGSPALHAYDASNLASELYNSNQNRGRDALGSYVKFSVPTVANGKVYAGTQNALAVYGLLSRRDGAGRHQCRERGAKFARPGLDRLHLWREPCVLGRRCARLPLAPVARGNHRQHRRFAGASVLRQPHADQRPGSLRSPRGGRDAHGVFRRSGDRHGRGDNPVHRPGSVHARARPGRGVESGLQRQQPGPTGRSGHDPGGVSDRPRPGGQPRPGRRRRARESALADDSSGECRDRRSARTGGLLRPRAGFRRPLPGESRGASTGARRLSVGGLHRGRERQGSEQQCGYRQRAIARLTDAVSRTGPSRPVRAAWNRTGAWARGSRALRGDSAPVPSRCRGGAAPCTSPRPG